MFVGRAEEALRFYVETFPDAEVLTLEHHGPEIAELEGTVKSATFRIGDLTLRCIDSPPVHDFSFTPSVSFFFVPAKKAHPAFLVADLNEFKSIFRQHGIDVVVDQPLEGFDRCYVHDPFGNRIELIQRVTT